MYVAARDGAHMDFSRAELVWINNALNGILHGPEAIEQREFHAQSRCSRSGQGTAKQSERSSRCSPSLARVGAEGHQDV